jgi:hypothetical protein
LPLCVSLAKYRLSSLYEAVFYGKYSIFSIILSYFPQKYNTFCKIRTNKGAPRRKYYVQRNFYGGTALYRNDNEGKYALLAAIFAMIIFTLVSCGKEMRALSGGSRDIAERIYERAGIDARNMEETEIYSSEAYILGMEEMHFLDKVEKACIYRPALLSAERSLCVVVAKSERFAEEIFEEMAKSYEWAPCDPARSAVFMQYGKYVLLGKDNADGARAVSAAFAAETGGGAKTDFSHNPM